MATLVHFVDAGQGNMVLIEAANGSCFVFDCNVTDKNVNRVLEYVERQIGRRTPLHSLGVLSS